MNSLNNLFHKSEEGLKIGIFNISFSKQIRKEWQSLVIQILKTNVKILIFPFSLKNIPVPYLGKMKSMELRDWDVSYKNYDKRLYIFILSLNLNCLRLEQKNSYYSKYLLIKSV